MARPALNPKLVIFARAVSWALAHNALTQRRTKAASIRLDDAEALEAAASRACETAEGNAWLHAQVQTSADLFAWLLRQADQHHVDFYVVYTLDLYNARHRKSFLHAAAD